MHKEREGRTISRINLFFVCFVLFCLDFLFFWWWGSHSKRIFTLDLSENDKCLVRFLKQKGCWRYFGIR